MEIFNTRNASRTHGIKALIYAKSGYGKTYLARTAPNPIILSAESGVLTLRDVDLPMVIIKTVKDLETFYQLVTTDKRYMQFGTIYVDSLSEIAEVVLANAKNVVKDQRQAYVKLTDDLIPLIKAYRDLPNKHVVFTAKQDSNKDELTGIVTQGPMMPGTKLGKELPYLFDEVFRLGIGKTDKGVQYRYIQTQPDAQNEAKDRSGILDAMEPPDLTKIFNKILAATAAT